MSVRSWREYFNQNSYAENWQRSPLLRLRLLRLTHFFLSLVV